MSDVEKYGLFALVFVAGVLGLAWVLDPLDDSGGDAGPVERAVVMSRPSPAQPGEARRTLALPRPESAPRENEPAPRTPRSVRVPRLDEGLGAFDPAEPPVPYPGPRSVPAPLGDATVPEYVVVKKGDTLSALALRHLGKASRHPEIAALNPDVDPRNLLPGTRVRLPQSAARATLGTPPATQVATAARTAAGLYTVRSGDTLSQIAQKLKGSVTYQDEILAANADLLSDPDALSVGMTLRIP